MQVLGFKEFSSEPRTWTVVRCDVMGAVEVEGSSNVPPVRTFGIVRVVGWLADGKEGEREKGKARGAAI